MSELQSHSGQFSTLFRLASSFVLGLTVMAAGELNATPAIALKEADNCAGCHKPGRGQQPFLQRRCTLDCQGCHIDPSGAGPRNQWGYYYTHTSAGVAAVNFYEPQDPLQDTSRIDFHSDYRVIRRDTAEKTRVFPMSAEGSVRVRPFIRYLHLTYQALLMGRMDDEQFRVVREGDRRFREKYSIMIDQIPLNTYVRAYRGIPMYGLREPNHTLWIRERIGLDQFATTEAVELGTAPNVPYFRASYMRGNPYVSEELRQKGLSYHAGLRGVTLGWHLNTSGWRTESDHAKIAMRSYGAGLNLFDLLLYGERNYREVTVKKEAMPTETDPTGRPIRTHPGSRINFYRAMYAGIPGVMFGTVYETLESDHLDSKRTSFVIDLHPIPNVQFELWRRFESGSRTTSDTLAIAHVYGDF